MFAKNVVQSSKFLKMPVSSRELYFQLGMSADDDGIVEAWNILKITNCMMKTYNRITRKPGVSAPRCFPVILFF